VESGVDLEMRIAAIYQDCRTPDQVRDAFDALQRELDTKIKAGLDSARRAFLENFDADVHARLRVHKDSAKQSLDAQQRMLLDLARFGFAGRATFDPEEPRFVLRHSDTLQTRFHLEWQRAEALGDTFFRVDHPQAQSIIDKAIAEPTPATELTFLYEAHASALHRYLGRDGWLEVSKFSADAVGRSEEFLLVAACDDDGQAIEPEVAQKLFSLGARLGPSLTAHPPVALAPIREDLKDKHLQALRLRNEAYFEEEVDKLDRWSDDVKFALERELRDLDSEIKAAKKASKTALALADKLAAQKAIKTLEQRRTTKRRQIFDAQDDVDKKRSGLIEDIERQLETRTSLEQVFVVRWHLEGAPTSTAAEAA
jgi:adenine-specific DNA-methyltransferase